MTASPILAAAAALAVAGGWTLSHPAAAEAVHEYQGASLSADGAFIASVESDQNADDPKTPHGRIVVRDASGKVAAIYDPCGACRYAGLAFAPDSDAVAFIATDRATGSAALEVAEAGAVRSIVEVKGNAGVPRWSPDGRTLALLVTIGAHKEVGAVQAGAPLTGEIGSVVDEQRIAVVPRAGGALRLVSPVDTWVYEYDWTPDGRGFVATAAKGDGDDNWWIAKLVRFDAETGAQRILAAPKYQMNAPRVSPDGRTVAFIGGIMSDFGSVGGDLFTVSLDGGEPKDVTQGFKGSFTGVVWRGDRLLASALEGGSEVIAEVSPKSGAVRTLATLDGSTSAGDGHFALDAKGRTAVMASQTFSNPPALKVGPLADLRTVTHDNDALSPHVEARSVVWTSEGYRVQGWLLSPVARRPGVQYPMITIVHGGPSAASTPSYVSSGTVRDLIDHGYYVFEPNPRGSYGQGEAFTEANVRDLGGGDLRDILAGVDAVEKIAPIDDRRLGVYGHSYGGFMTMWSVTHTNRFHAAVAGAGVANWVSYYGENGIDQWMLPFFGASAYDDPAIYDKLSPIRAIKNAKTPTFIYVGERDVECPAPQSIEFWHGLKAEGVETSLVIYEGEGHRIGKPEHMRDLAHRLVAWFDDHLKAKDPAS